MEHIKRVVGSNHVYFNYMQFAMNFWYLFPSRLLSYNSMFLRMKDHPDNTILLQLWQYNIPH